MKDSEHKRGDSEALPTLRDNTPTPKGDRSLARKGEAGQGYSNSELESLYALSRMYLLAGETHSSEKIARGLTAVAPDFEKAWLLLSYLLLMKEDLNGVFAAARQALRIHTTSLEALLFLVISAFEGEDFQSGGTYLGEVADLLGQEDARPELRRVYESQTLRFEQRLKRKRTSTARERLG
ncbi:hypothetical protein MRY87_00250 [bacterium]|nr:hypothetical protein [bacterium]